MNIDTATQDQILTEVLLNGEMYSGLDYDSLAKLCEAGLRDAVRGYIIANSEV